MKNLLLAALLLVLPASAWAVCPNPLTVKDAAGTTQNISTTNDASGNCQSNINVTQFGGNNIVTGTGAAGVGIPRVTISNDSSLTGIAAGVTTSGATGSPVMGAVTTAAPSYTTGQINWLSLDTSGNLRTTMQGIGATAAAPPVNAIYNGANGSGATGGQLQGLVVCDKYVFKHITSATDTLAVQGVASQTIRICGFHARAAGVATWFLENTASANANCSSSNTQISILNTEAANTGISDHTPFWNGLSNTSGNGLCINSTGTGGVDVGIYYAQF